MLDSTCTFDEIIEMKALVLIIVFLNTSILWSQTEKCEPSKCTREKSEKYIVELAGCYSYLHIYVLNQQGEALRDKEITGTVEFFYLDETILRGEFSQYFKTNSLRAKIPSPGFYNCRIALQIDEEYVVVAFENECHLQAKTEN